MDLGAQPQRFEADLDIRLTPSVLPLLPSRALVFPSSVFRLPSIVSHISPLRSYVTQRSNSDARIAACSVPHDPCALDHLCDVLAIPAVPVADGRRHARGGGGGGAQASARARTRGGRGVEVPLARVQPPARERCPPRVRAEQGELASGQGASLSPLCSVHIADRPHT